jgi:hypothetical protein
VTKGNRFGSPFTSVIAMLRQQRFQSWGRVGDEQLVQIERSVGPAIRRAAYLREIAQQIRANKEVLARTITEEQGKVLTFVF